MELIYMITGALVFAIGFQVGYNIRNNVDDVPSNKRIFTIPKIPKREKDILPKENEDNDKINKFFN